MKWQAGLLAVAAGTLMFLGSAGTAKAHPSDRRCFERIHREQHKLERDIRRHGVFSRQAQNRRNNIARLRHQCGYGFRSGRNDRWDNRGRDDRYGWDGRTWGDRDRDRDRDRRGRNRGRP